MADELKDRWKTADGQERLNKILQAIRGGQDNWQDILNDFPKVKDMPNGNGKDLRSVDLSDQRLIGAPFSEVALTGANFQNTNLTKADFSKASLNGACFNKANLKKADLSGTWLSGAKFVAADIGGSKFDDSKLGGGFVSPIGGGSTRANVNFSSARFNPTTSFLGVDIGNNNWAGNPVLRRHIEDHQWLHAWRSKSRLNKYCLYPIWMVSCDCGRSFILWAIWSMIIAIRFGCFFQDNAECFHMSDGATLAEAHWFTPFYYSIITFTTLGFGDVVPDAANGMMQLYVTLEVILGYMMLGGLISILASKLARRS